MGNWEFLAPWDSRLWSGERQVDWGKGTEAYGGAAIAGGAIAGTVLSGGTLAPALLPAAAAGLGMTTHALTTDSDIPGSGGVSDQAAAAAARAAAQRTAVEQGWTDIIARNQDYLKKSRIYDEQGNKDESNPFWSRVRSGQSDIRAGFDNQQHDLSGVLSSRGMMGSGQEAAMRTGLAGSQARTLVDFETGQVDRQEDIVRGLEQRDLALREGKVGVDQQLYGTDLGLQLDARGRRDASQAADRQFYTDLFGNTAKAVGYGFGQNPDIFKLGGFGGSAPAPVAPPPARAGSSYPAVRFGPPGYNPDYGSGYDPGSYPGYNFGFGR